MTPLSVLPANIPAELQAARRWVTWRLDDREGKPTKVPYAPDGTRKARSNDGTTWGSFAEAYGAATAGGFDGIGYQLVGGAYTVIDLDHCRNAETGAFTDDAALAVVMDVDSYTEISPSGEGVHIIVRGAPPKGRRRHGRFEMYGPADGRYITMTGRVIMDRLEIREHDLAALHATLFGDAEDDRASRTTPTHGDSPHASASLVLAKALDAANGPKVRSLLDGRIDAYGDDHSAAQYALACVLAFYTQDADTLAEIIEASDMPRDDDDLRKLRNHDIPNAVAGLRETFDWSAEKGGVIIQTSQPIAGVSAQTSQPITHKIRLASTITPGRVSWLWKGYLPYGKITILDGDPGIGKSFIALDLAARVSTGRPMPNSPVAGSHARAPRGVVLLMPEDDDEDTIIPRLMRLDADLTRIAIISQTFDVSAPDGMAHLSEACDLVPDCGLVVFDPLLTYLGGDKSDVHRDRDVRRSLDPLIELAIRRKLVVLGNRHLTKAVKDGGNALYRGMGSIGIVAVARVGLVVARNPEGEGNVLAVSKNNLIRTPASLRWHVEPDADDDALAWVQWGEAILVDADALVTGPEAARGGSSQTEIEEAITTYLRQCGGEAPSAELIEYVHEMTGAAASTIAKWRGKMPGIEIFATKAIPPVWMTRRV